MSERTTDPAHEATERPDDGLAGALAALAVPDGAAVLVGLDFDGTLAPLVDDPTASAMTPAARAAVERLAALPDDARVRLALVSGRDLADLAARAAPPAGTYLVGSHGAETGRVHAAAEAGTGAGDGAGTGDGAGEGDGATRVDAVPVRLEPEQAAVLERLVAGLQEIAAGTEGAWVQTKPSAAVLHTRRSPREAARAAAARADAVVAGLGLHALHGKDVVEVAVLPTDKGSALARLRDVVGQDAGAPAVRVLYAGDDTTDEHAFEVLGAGDVTVKVGPGRTAAAHRVADADGVAGALDHLADLLGRRGADGG
jgi:trehalose-6-phosphatase